MHLHRPAFSVCNNSIVCPVSLISVIVRNSTNVAKHVTRTQCSLVWPREKNFRVWTKLTSFPKKRRHPTRKSPESRNRILFEPTEVPRSVSNGIIFEDVVFDILLNCNYIRISFTTVCAASSSNVNGSICEHLAGETLPILILLLTDDPRCTANLLSGLSTVLTRMHIIQVTWTQHVCVIVTLWTLPLLYICCYICWSERNLVRIFTRITRGSQPSFIHAAHNDDDNHHGDAGETDKDIFWLKHPSCLLQVSSDGVISLSATDSRSLHITTVLHSLHGDSIRIGIIEGRPGVAIVWALLHHAHIYALSFCASLLQYFLDTLSQAFMHT